jgi:hypothetical protein
MNIASEIRNGFLALLLIVFSSLLRTFLHAGFFRGLAKAGNHRQ